MPIIAGMFGADPTCAITIGAACIGSASGEPIIGAASGLMGDIGDPTGIPIPPDGIACG